MKGKHELPNSQIISGLINEIHLTFFYRVYPRQGQPGPNSSTSKLPFFPVFDSWIHGSSNFCFLNYGPSFFFLIWVRRLSCRPSNELMTDSGSGFYSLSHDTVVRNVCLSVCRIVCLFILTHSVKLVCPYICPRRSNLPSIFFWGQPVSLIYFHILPISALYFLVPCLPYQLHPKQRLLSSGFKSNNHVE